MSKFAVTLNYHCDYGYVEYDSENKKAEVVLKSAEAKARVEKFLQEKLTLEPLASLENFKICLTRLWFHTDVLVEWSMPPGMAENL